MGDLVGYGAFPDEVVEFIRSHSILTQMGNYDDGVGFDQVDCGCDLLFFGDIHLLYHKSAAGALFVDVGSVGKPKGGDQRAGDVLLELGWGSRVHFRRVAYDVTAAARAICQAKPPPQFADLLESDGVPHETEPAALTALGS